MVKRPRMSDAEFAVSVAAYKQQNRTNEYIRKALGYSKTQFYTKLKRIRGALEARETANTEQLTSELKEAKEVIKASYGVGLQIVQEYLKQAKDASNQYEAQALRERAFEQLTRLLLTVRTEVEVKKILMGWDELQHKNIVVIFQNITDEQRAELVPYFKREVCEQCPIYQRYMKDKRRVIDVK